MVFSLSSRSSADDVAVQQLSDKSADQLATAYTLYSFLHRYRKQVIKEIFRVLKACGQFINGDRYGLDNISQHTHTVQAEISPYFKVLLPLGHNDLLK